MVQFKDLPEELAAQLDGLEILALQDPNDSDIVKKIKLDELEKALEVLAKNVQDAAWTASNVVKLRAGLTEDLPGQVYADPQEALDYILAQSPSENDPWVLEFGAGVWDVSGLDISGVPRLTIRGQSKQINQTWTATPGTRLKVSSGYLFDEISTPVLVSNVHITLDGGTAVLGLSGNGAYFNEVAFELGAAGQIYGDTGGANNIFFRCFFEGAAHLVQTHGDTFVDCDFNADNPAQGVRLQTGDTAGRRVFNLYGCRRLPNAAASRPFFDVSNLNDDCTVRLVDCDVQDASGGASDYVNAPAAGTTTIEIRKTALGGAQINGAVVIDGNDLSVDAGGYTPGSVLDADSSLAAATDGERYPKIKEALEYLGANQGALTLSIQSPGTVRVHPKTQSVSATAVLVGGGQSSYRVRGEAPCVRYSDGPEGNVLLGSGGNIDMSAGNNFAKVSAANEVLLLSFANIGIYGVNGPYLLENDGGQIRHLTFDDVQFVSPPAAGPPGIVNFIDSNALVTQRFIINGGAWYDTGSHLQILPMPSDEIGMYNVFFKKWKWDLQNTLGARTVTLRGGFISAQAGFITESASTQATTVVLDNVSIEPGAVELISAATVNVTVQLRNGTKLNGNTVGANVTLVDEAILSEILYTPGNGADWTDPDPTNVQDALDRIAAAIGPIA